MHHRMIGFIGIFINLLGWWRYSTKNAKCLDLDALSSVEILKRHYKPKPLAIAESFNFHRCTQHARESVKDFVAELQHITIHCEFGIRIT